MPRAGRAQLRTPPDYRARAQPPASAPPARALVVEAVELAGNTRTSPAVAMRAARIAAGDPADLTSIQAAAARLRASRLFRDVLVHTRPGSRPGRVRVVFQVKENRPHLRFGLGYEDFSGWYLIPIQFSLDNITGHGEGIALGLRFGYRVSGLDLAFRRPLWSSADYWEVRLRAEGLDRIYFLEEAEVTQAVARTGVDFRLGHQLARSAALETWLSLESARVDSNAVVYRDRPVLGHEQGDDVPYDVLPSEIQSEVGDRPQTRAGLALLLNRHGSPGAGGAGGASGASDASGSSAARAGAAAVQPGGLGSGGFGMSGVWARLSTEGVLSSGGNFARLEGEVRTYQPLWRGGLLAGRVRAAAVTARAPFYERLYLGGLYTVRGYPSHALSPPHGDARLATASFELRTAWIGPPERPRLTGLVFADAGIGWDDGEVLSLADGAAAAGFGWRVRVPWLGQIGVDVGVPFSPAPVDEAFHVNLSLGWVY